MIDQFQKVHLVGAGGIGLSALGKWYLHRGARVTGSDLVSSAQTDELLESGATIKIGQGIEHVPDDVELLIYSPAVPMDNPERARARELGAIEMSYPQALGEMAKQYRTIAVTGTHGKSTITAMIGLILETAGLDPTVIVGSKVYSWPQKNFRAGASNFFVVEACEHLASFLNIHPDIAVITNIEMDHPDFYRDLAHVQETFAQFMSQVKEKVFLGEKDFNLDAPHLEGLSLKIPGEFNVMNAHCAAAVAKHLGVADEVIVKTLNAFEGLWRRFERVSVWRGADIISDYGHHPTAIVATLKGTREFFPNRRIVLCFQPHQHSRTKELFNDFVPSFDGADVLVIAEIYAVSGRLEAEGDVSSEDLVASVKKRDNEKGTVRDIFYAKDLDEAERELRDIIQPSDVVLIMGAGDIDDVARRFASYE